MVVINPSSLTTITAATLAVLSMQGGVGARPTFPGALEPGMKRMERMVIRSSPPPPLPEGVQTADRRDFRPARKVARRATAGSKRSPDHSHEHSHR